MNPSRLYTHDSEPAYQSSEVHKNVDSATTIVSLIAATTKEQSCVST